MASVNTINPKIDLTVRVFDDFYGFSLEVDANEYDAVNSYFESVFNDKQIAQNFTTSLFRVAEQTGVPVLTILQQLEGQDQITLTNTLCYYLNGLRSPATLLGINSAVTPNYWTARNVLP
jgi:hypothetical protein